MNTMSIYLYIKKEYSINSKISVKRDNMTKTTQTTQEKFRTALLSLLQEEGLSQTELAKKLNISKQHLHNIIKGRRAGTDEIREKIANYFGLTVEEMLNIGSAFSSSKSSRADTYSYVFAERLKKILEYKKISWEELCKIAKINPKAFNNYLKGRKDPSPDLLKRVAAALNVPVGYFFGEVSLEELSGRTQDLTKDVHFIKPKVLYNGDANVGPIDEDYLAVPLVSEAGASISGIIPQEEIKSWILVYSPALPARISQNLLAVKVAKNEFSMVPTLHPGDIVLIDRQDFVPEEGGIYLVRLAEPDWPISIKRVNMVKRNGQVNIVFSSDNPDKREYPPIIYDFKEYDNDFNKAIIGRVVWAWSDMTKK